MTLSKVFIKIINCTVCPCCETDKTPGAGCAIDYFCAFNRKNRKLLKGYVEWGSEEPQDHEIPDWCPLAKEKNK